MPASGQTYGLLSPPPETFQKRSQKSNSSVDSKSSYFSSVISHEEPSLRDSLFEGPSTASFISAALASPSCASNNESEYSTESQYLTPPEIDAGNEKPPYKARSPSAASLNMTASQSELITHPKHKYQGKQQRLQDEYTPSQKIQGHEQLSQEQGNNLQQGLPGHNERCPANAECEPESEPLKSVRGPKRTIKNLTHIGDSSSFLFSAPATNITTRRWSSIGIGTHEPTQSDSFRLDPTCNVLANDSQERSNSWNHVPGSEDITRSLRARLTFRQIPPNHLSTPATITLRRASGVSLHNSEGLPTKPNPDFISPLLPQASQWTDTRPPAATYLITKGDVDFIVNLVQASFDIRRTTVDTPDCNCVALRKPSVTGQGVIPQPGIPADLATAIADVHQILKIPRVSFKDSKLPDSKVKTGATRKWSRSPSLQNVREVIWEETGSTGSHSISPKGSYMFDEGGEVMDNLSLAWLLGQSSSASHRINSPYAGFRRDDRSKSSDGGDKSPTCHETFEEPTEKMESSLQPFPNQSTFEQNPDSTSEPFKKDSFSPISLFTPEVVSFPPLPARKCTTDWILPLPGISAPASGDHKSLHGTCIDAQGSKEQYGPLRHIGEPDVQEGAPERHHSSPNLDIGSQTKQKSAFLLHPQVSHGLGGPFKVGYALGCGPGARRKSSTQFMRLEISDKILEHHFHQDQTSWVKPRKDSGWPTPKSPPPEELDQSKSKMKHEGRIDLLKSLTPLLPEADHSGIYAAFTGTQKEKIMCEADCRQKHVCGNTPSDSRNPSTDWIGQSRSEIEK